MEGTDLSLLGSQTTGPYKQGVLNRKLLERGDGQTPSVMLGVLEIGWKGRSGVRSLRGIIGTTQWRNLKGKRDPDNKKIRNGT